MLISLRLAQIDDDTGELRQYGPQSSFAHLPGPASPAEVSNAFSPSSASVRSEVGLWPPAAETPGTVDWSRHLPVASIPGFDESLHEHMLDLFFNYFEPCVTFLSAQLPVPRTIADLPAA